MELDLSTLFCINLVILHILSLIWVLKSREQIS